MAEIANLKKIPTGTCVKTPSKMCMNDIVTIDSIVFEIVGGGFKPRIVNFLKYPGSDWVKCWYIIL